MMRYSTVTLQCKVVASYITMCQGHHRKVPTPIENISDTARWMAYVCALESARPDALFHVAFAQRVAGEARSGLRALMLNYADTCVRLDDIRW